MLEVGGTAIPGSLATLVEGTCGCTKLGEVLVGQVDGVLFAKLEAVTGETRVDTGTYSLRSNTGAVVGNRLFVIEVAPLLTGSD